MKIWEPKKEEEKPMPTITLADPIYTLKKEGQSTVIKAIFHDGIEQNIMILHPNFRFTRIRCIPTLRESDYRAIDGRIEEGGK